MDTRIKPGVLVRAHRKGDDMHGFKSGQLVRVVQTDGDEVYATGRGMGWSSNFYWGTAECGMYLYPGEYKYAKQANKKES